MKVSEIRAMTSEEIKNKMDEAYHELFNLRFQHSSAQLKNTNRLKEVKRDIARMKTVLHERELAQLEGTGELR
ncbi:MAG: 50S ribosomal protein L29 [Anaerolineae bacterium]